MYIEYLSAIEISYILEVHEWKLRRARQWTFKSVWFSSSPLIVSFTNQFFKLSLRCCAENCFVLSLRLRTENHFVTIAALSQ